jgi:DNA-binding GntR family transcriptional regulator
MLEQHGLYELLRALLTMERTAYDQAGGPVEFARHLYRASRYTFTTSLPRLEAGNG